jgi:hypothetical protein
MPWNRCSMYVSVVNLQIWYTWRGERVVVFIGKECLRSSVIKRVGAFLILLPMKKGVGAFSCLLCTRKHSWSGRNRSSPVWFLK